MKSQKGIGLVSLVILVVCLILIAGVATYVALSSDVFVQPEEKQVVQQVNNEVK